jgi:peptide/nickel transport system permease protein
VSSTDVGSVVAADHEDGAYAQPSWRQRQTGAVRAIWSTPEGLIGTGILVVLLLVITIGPHVAPYSPYAIGVGPPAQGPSSAHLLGTDTLGRDILSRVLTGGGSVIVIPLLGILIAFAIGGFLGMLAGYLGGWPDLMTSRTVDVMLSLPPLLMILVVVSAAGSSTAVLVLAVAVVYAPRIARVLRGATRGPATREYVLAAQARGERNSRIVLREILPNIYPTFFVEFASRLSYAIIFIATLNFLGLGLQPPSSNWAVMVADSRISVTTAPLATVIPAVAIGALSVGIGLIADAVSRHSKVTAGADLLR